MKNKEHILTQLYTSLIRKNEALSFLIHYTSSLCMMCYIARNRSLSLLFKIPMVLQDFALNFVLDFQLDLSYASQL